MNYRHAYHAGNFADVHKHLTLLALIEVLQRKDTPILVMDTHAGAGLYSLRGGDAARTGEWREGIGRIFAEAKAPAAVCNYMAQVRALNADGILRLYPGSPVLAANVLRKQDRLILCELEPGTHALLKTALKGGQGIAIHQRDGWEALKALLPPKDIKRGLVLIDPPYEVNGEYERLADALVSTHKRWRQGVLVGWFPIKARPIIDRLLRQLRAAGLPDLLYSELCIHAPTTGTRLNGSGMVIVNAPWKLDATLRESTLWLHDRVHQSPGAPWRVDILEPSS